MALKESKSPWDLYHDLVSRTKDTTTIEKLPGHAHTHNFLVYTSSNLTTDNLLDLCNKGPNHFGGSVELLETLSNLQENPTQIFKYEVQVWTD